MAARGAPGGGLIQRGPWRRGLLVPAGEDVATLYGGAGPSVRGVGHSITLEDLSLRGLGADENEAGALDARDAGVVPSAVSITGSTAGTLVYADEGTGTLDRLRIEDDVRLRDRYDPSCLQSSTPDPAETPNTSGKRTEWAAGQGVIQTVVVV